MYGKLLEGFGQALKKEGDKRDQDGRDANVGIDVQNILLILLMILKEIRSRERLPVYAIRTTQVHTDLAHPLVIYMPKWQLIKFAFRCSLARRL